MSITLAERLARARSGGELLPKVRAKVRHRKPVKTNRFDDLTWKSARPMKPANDLVRDLFTGDLHAGGTRQQFSPAEELAEGVFHTFYKANPQRASVRELERDLTPVAKILEDLAEHPRVKELHDYTFTNETMSTLALADMQETLREIVLRLQQAEEPPPPGGGDEGEQGQGGQGGVQSTGQEGGQQEGQSEGSEGSDQGEQDDSEGQTDGQDDQSDGQNDGSDGQNSDLGDEAEDQWEEDWDDLFEDLNIAGLLDQGVNEALRDMQELDTRIRGIGIEPGQWETMTPEQRLAMAEWLSGPEMKDLADMVGRMKKHALQIRKTRVTDEPLEAYDVELGDDLTVILQDQYALLSDPYASLEFYRRYADRELFQYKRRAIEEVAKGPIKAVIDKTASMKGKKMHWALGIAESLRRFASDDGRDFSATFFSTNAGRLDRKTFFFPEGKGDVQQIIAFLSVKPSGGTEFESVLADALEEVVTVFDDEEKGKADIVFITDGQASLSDRWVETFNAEKERAETHLYSVFISGADDVTTPPLKLLERISDLVIPANYLKPQAATEIFRRV